MWYWNPVTVGVLAVSLATSIPAVAEDGITVALVLDTSASIRSDELTRTRTLCVGLLAHLPAGSEVALFTFDDQDRLLLPWTQAPQDVERALSIVRPTGHYTLLYDALYDASRQLHGGPAGRKALVLLTDGKDEGSALDLEDGLRAAQESRFPVFTIGVGRVQERILRRIAKLTGGEYSPIAKASSEALASDIAKAAATTTDNANVSRNTTGPASANAAAPNAPPTGATRVAAAAAPPPGTRSGLWLVAGGALLLVAIASVVTLRRRAGPRCPRCRFELPSALAPCTYCSAEANARIAESASGTREPIRVKSSPPRPEPPMRVNASLVSETVLARLNNTEEFLEKTITLREKPVLVIIAGAGSGRVFTLSEMAATSLGRAKMNDIVLEDISVSSEHCRIRPENGAFVVHDLKSTNGTYINEKKIAHQPLVAGDTLKLGETSLQFRLDHQRAN